MAKGTCSEAGCEREHFARGFCQPHYQLHMRTGLISSLPVRTVEQRFWDKVTKTDTCWLWTGAKSAGYGKININYNYVPTHRYSWELINGPIPDGFEVDHQVTCPKNCCNPSHLKLVTKKQNGENRTGPSKASKSRVLGVYWNTRQNKWQTEVRHNDHKYFAGYFTDLHDAEVAVRRKRVELFTNNPEDVRWLEENT